MKRRDVVERAERAAASGMRETRSVRRARQRILSLFSPVLCSPLPLVLLLIIVISLLVSIPHAFAFSGQARARGTSAASGQECTGTHRSPSFGTTTTVEHNEVICSDLTAFTGTLVIRGIVRGNIVVFSGDMLITGTGTVIGDVTLYDSSITLQDDATVQGNIYSCGVQPTLEPNAHLHGDVIGCPQSIDQLVRSDVGVSVRFWSLVTWIALGLLLSYLLPEHMAFVRTTSLHKMRRSITLGLLTVLLSLPVLAILIALIVSIPLAIIVVVGLIVAWAMGVVAVGSLVGDYLLRKVAIHYNTRVWQVVVGIVVLTVVEWLPYVGLVVQIGVGLLGLGAVVLSRFGTRLYSQPKQPMRL